MEILNRTAVKVLEKFPFLYAHALLRKKSPLRDWGWFRSFKTRESVDADGRPLPWLTFGCIEFLRPRIWPEMQVFEFGSGNGTRWWAEHVSRVVSVEHDPEWSERVERSLPANAELIRASVSDGSYAGSAAASGHLYDIIVIDGVERVACATQSLTALKHDGVIIWDDSMREAYSEGFEYLAAHGFRHIEFRGFSPIEFMMRETAIFYRSNNCLNI